MAIKRFTLILGIFLVAAGILGFFPGFVTFPAHESHDVFLPGQHEMNHNVGLLFGLFPINALHNLVHIGLGIWALAASRTVDNSRKFNRANAVIYGILAVFGIIPGLSTLFGLVPLYSHDIWLHGGIAIVSAYFGFSWIERAAGADRSVEDQRRTG